MKSPIRFGLIGAGGIGGYHLSTLESLEREGLVRLVAVTDPQVERFAEKRAQLESRGVRWHSDYREMLAQHRGELDAVTIATPIPLHFEMTQACLDHDLFIYLEKPPAPLIQQLDRLIEADPKHRVNVGFQMILSKPVQQLKQWIAAGELGEIEQIHAGGCWPRLDSYYNRASWVGSLTHRGEPVFDGPATNAFAHLIHNIMFLASPHPDNFDTPVSIRGELYRARPIESYDIACLQGQLASGATFSLAVTHATEELLPFRISVRGSRGWARISADGGLLESSLGELDYPETTLDLLDTCYHHFVDYVNGERPRFHTRLEDTRGYVLATNGMKLSSRNIHDVGPQWIRQYHHEKDRGFDVHALRQAVDASFDTGRLFSDLETPWGVSSEPVSVENLTNFSLNGERETSEQADRCAVA